MGNVREKELAILLKAKADVDAAFASLKGELAGAEQVAKDTAAAASRSWEDSVAKIRNVAAIGFAAVAGSIGFAAREAAQGELGMSNFRSAVKNAGGDADALSNKLNDTAMRLQRLTGIADDEYIDAAARMTDITGDAAGSIDNLGLVADLAVARKIPLASAADAVARAMEGEIGALARIMPGLDEQVRALGENAKQADIVAVIFDRLAQFEGRAAAAADNTAGAVNKLKQEMAAAVENAGNPFLEIIRTTAERLTPVVQKTGEWAAEHQGVVAAIGAGAIGLTGFLTVTSSIALVIPKVVTGMAMLKTAAIALAASPWTVVATGIIAVAGVAWQLSDAMTATAKSEGNLKKITEETGVSYQSLRIKQEEIFGKFADYRSGTDAQRAAWDNYVLSLYAAKEPLAMTEQQVNKNSAAHKVAAEQVSINASAIRDLMNAGLEYQEAAALARGAVLPTQEVSTTSPDAHEQELADYRDLVGAKGQIYIQGIELQEQADEQARARRIEAYAAEQELWRGHLGILGAGFDTFTNTLVNIEMTGRQRRDAIVRAGASFAIQLLSQQVKHAIASDILMTQSKVTSTVAGTAAVTGAAATEQAATAATNQGYLTQLATKIYSWYASFGPFGIPAAAATVAAIIAAIRGLRFAEGGVVPGSGFGDKVPAMLEPGEFVVRRSAAQQNYGALQAMNSGRSVGGSVTVPIALYIDGQGLSLEKRLEIRDLVEEMLPRAIERALDERRFSMSFAA
ncbi:hypothetical protein HUU59_10895 [bacterium]|nr:hypothetical protein [bacterium]